MSASAASFCMFRGSRRCLGCGADQVTQSLFRNQMCDLQNINSFHQLPRCSKITTKTNSCLRHPLLPVQKAEAEHASKELRDKTNHVKTICRNTHSREVMRKLVIQRRRSGHTWSPSTWVNPNSLRVCATMSREPSHRCWEEHSLVSFSLGRETYKRLPFFPLLPSSQAIFSSSKNQNMTRTVPCNRERSQKTDMTSLWPLGFDIRTKITHKPSLPL